MTAVYIIEYQAAAKAVSVERMEQWVPLLFRIVKRVSPEGEEIDNIKLEWTGSATWSEEHAITKARQAKYKKETAA